MQSVKIVNRLLDMQGLHNGGSCVIKRWLSYSCLTLYMYLTLAKFR